VEPFGQIASKRRVNNNESLAIFGLGKGAFRSDGHCHMIREGNGTTVFTIGYEKRNGDELISLLLDAGVDVLVDVREKPMSRKSDFRGKVLDKNCGEAGICYLNIPELGSTGSMRTFLKETGNIKTFLRRYRKHAEKKSGKHISQLTKMVKQKSVALLCYERCHDDCHRKVVADLVADEIDASIVAII